MKTQPKKPSTTFNLLQITLSPIFMFLFLVKTLLHAVIFLILSILVFLSWAVNLRPKLRRGRPRTQPIFKFYRQKFNRRLTNLIPKRTQIRISLICLALIFIYYSTILVKLGSSLPSPEHLSPNNRPLTTQIYDREGTLLYQFYEGFDRKLVKFDELPPQLILATIATEDKNFFNHPGVDIEGLSRALKANFTGQSLLQGGSTITQQLIKNTLLTPERTWQRKVKEIILALWTESTYSKKEILQMYFNEVAFGGPLWGIEAAARMYFGKGAAELNLAESAYLAGLPAAPSEFSPYGTHPEKGEARQKEVLRRMRELKFITPEQEELALNFKLQFQPPRQEIKAPHFVMYIKELIAAKYGNRTVSQGGLKILTTLDLGVQEIAEAAVFNTVNSLRVLRVGNGAAMVMDSKTGQILAMVGSYDYFSSESGNYNVTLALRQPGSAIKPITYLTAFKLGFTPGNVILDTPTTFKNPWGKSYTPLNYDGRFHGAITLRQALGSSYNIPAVKLLSIVGIPAMLQTAHELGLPLSTPDQYGLSLTLGGGAVRMIDMMTTYQTIANGGVRSPQTAILAIYDSSGKVLEDNRQLEGKRVVAEELTYLVTDILTDSKARESAFGRSSKLEIPKYTVAVKTGTSDEKRDNWTFGYTPEFVVGTWVGNPDNSPMDQNLASGITGAAPIYNEIMSALLLNRPNLIFKKPVGIVEVSVDGHKDIGIAGTIPKTVITTRKVKEKDQTTGEEKEVVKSFDSFSVNQ